ncbi:MAG TPA: hypothetical protein VLA11_01100 [Woeseiaceae bacterium]|jgi:hypothetical protein|nr:hypothetical protein [Woeseiaceae bacterium]
MRVDSFSGVFLTLLVFIPGAVVAQDAAALAQKTEISALRAELDALRTDYEVRIAELEQRLAIAEQNAEQNHGASQVVPAPAPPSNSNAAFNPAIGVVFQGFLSGVDGEPGEEEGFAVGETELIMSANVDDKFSAYLTAALAFEDGESEFELEEAWIETTALPAGFRARFGRMFSGIGYLNAKHAHTWDFADQALPYEAFLDGRYVDNGAQLRWLAPTDLYFELGGELMQGEGDPQGLGGITVFANLGGDIGADHSWLAGVSRLEQDAGQELHVAHIVWKWAPDGNWKQKNFIFQAEYLENSDLRTDDGWYAQAVFQPVPRWRIGARFDSVDLEADDPSRSTVMLDWSNSEFSRVRLQASRLEAGTTTENAWTLQYIHSIGAHGAHTF